MFSGLSFIYLEFGIDSIEFLFMSTSLVITILSSICVGYLFFFHMYLISYGLATLEYFEKFKRDIKALKKDIGLNNNFILNFKLIMGNNMLTWPFPVEKNTKYLGYLE